MLLDAIAEAGAFMELVRSNSQGELTPLERGMHALKSGLSVRDYAGNVGRSATSTAYERHAAEVFTYVNGREDFPTVPATSPSCTPLPLGSGRRWSLSWPLAAGRWRSRPRAGHSRRSTNSISNVCPAVPSWPSMAKIASSMVRSASSAHSAR